MPLPQAQLDILSVLKKANHVLILPSSPLDADGLGSALSLYLALKKLDKKVTIVAEENIPQSYNFLPGISVVTKELNFVRDFIVTIDCRENAPGKIRHEIQGNKINIFITPQTGLISKEQVSFNAGSLPYDCLVAVDAADPSQFGKLYENATELFHLVPVLNIDHHASNNSFGKINWVDILAASTTTLVLSLIEELGPNLMDADIATLLLAGLITDTGSFQNPNTTPDSFAVAAKLIGYGARQQEIIRNIYKTKKLSTLRLWGRTLTKLQYDEKHKFVWSVLTAKDFAEIGSSPDETEGVIDELMSNAPGTEIICLIKERGPLEVSCSLRTLTPSIDATKIAAIFGGGGHMQAAGFRVHDKTVQEVEKILIEKLRDLQKTRLHLIDETPVAAPAPSFLTPATPVPTPMPNFLGGGASNFTIEGSDSAPISSIPPPPAAPKPMFPPQPGMPI